MATVTATVTQAVTTTVVSAAASASSSTRVAPQGGILEGANPSVYDPKNPIIIFIIQASIIILLCRLLHYPLSLIRQPRVIAEVIGGILLGPSVLGRIPGFTDAIFPTASIPNLTLVANLGLVLFLFLVGLEVDLRFVTSNLVPALSVGAAGMILPFSLGCAIAWGLYNDFRSEPGTTPIAFGTYMLFVGVAMAITAFPVLCRILTELKLLSTPVGIITLSAGVSNDVVGWILLALCVALVNAGSGLTALWVLLTAVGYGLFLFIVVKPAFMWVLKRQRAIEEGPSQGIVVFTLMLALASAFFTGVIGVHPIFGAFMAGLICPHEGGFAIKVTEKIEDLISALFVPLYFALSGLSTNLGLLNSGLVWGYVIAITVVAFCAKFIGGTLAARLNGLVWRESFTIGVLMSCKGLVELIVLNIGLNAKILSTRTFTMFVVMALVTTFATTPLTAALYPPHYQRKLEAWKRGEIEWETGRRIDDDDNSSNDVTTIEKLQTKTIKSILIYLRLDNMPTILSLISLLGKRPSTSTTKVHPSKTSDTTPRRDSSSSEVLEKRAVRVHGIRLMELTQRGSSVMQVSEVDEYTHFDPVLNAFKVLCQIYKLAVSAEIMVGPASSYAEMLTGRAADEASDLLLLPWSETGSLADAQTITTDSVKNRLTNDPYTSFVASTLEQSQTNVAVLINKGFTGTPNQRPATLTRTMSRVSARRQAEPTLPSTESSHHIFVPFFGGADGRVAMRLALQLVENPEVTATFVHYQLSDDSFSTAEDDAWQQHVVVSGKEARDGQLSMSDANFFTASQRALPSDQAARVVFETVGTASLDIVLQRAQAEMAQSHPRTARDLIIFGRSTFGDVVFATPGKPASCLGAAAQMFLDSGIKASLMVLSAAR